MTSRVLRLLLSLVLLAAVTAGLAPHTKAGEAGTPVATPDLTTFPVTITDCYGQPVTFDAPPERVVTLDAYAAEFLIDLGLGDRVVGTGYPHPEAQIPADLRDDFAAIPQLSSGLACAATGLPSREAIVAAEPDFVLTVYAEIVGENDGQVRPSEISDIGASIFTACDVHTELVNDIEETFRFIQDLGAIFGVADAAADLEAGLRNRLDTVTTSVTGLEPTRVFALATDPNDGQPIPTWSGNTITNGIMALAGCVNIMADNLDTSFFPSAEQVAARDPQVLLIATDFSTSNGDELIAAAERNVSLGGSSAVRDGRYVILSHVLVGGPSPRNVEAVEAMAAACHPDAYSFSTPAA